MAIINTGIDIIEIERIKNAVERSSKFLDKVFTHDENSYFKSRNNSVCHIAGTFAAKEAVSKALGTGFSVFGWKDIEVKRDSKGKPFVSLHGHAKELAFSAGIICIHISISHSRDYAVAVAVAEGD